MRSLSHPAKVAMTSLPLAAMASLLLLSGAQVARAGNAGVPFPGCLDANAPECRGHVNEDTVVCCPAKRPICVNDMGYSGCYDQAWVEAHLPGKLAARDDGYPYSTITLDWGNSTASTNAYSAVSLSWGNSETSTTPCSTSTTSDLIVVSGNTEISPTSTSSRCILDCPTTWDTSTWHTITHPTTTTWQSKRVAALAVDTETYSTTSTSNDAGPHMTVITGSFVSLSNIVLTGAWTIGPDSATTSSSVTASPTTSSSVRPFAYDPSTPLAGPSNSTSQNVGVSVVVVDTTVTEASIASSFSPPSSSSSYATPLILAEQGTSTFSTSISLASSDVYMMTFSESDTTYALALITNSANLIPDACKTVPTLPEGGTPEFELVVPECTGGSAPLDRSAFSTATIVARGLQTSTSLAVVASTTSPSSVVETVIVTETSTSSVLVTATVYGSTVTETATASAPAISGTTFGQSREVAARELQSSTSLAESDVYTITVTNSKTTYSLALITNSANQVPSSCQRTVTGTGSAGTPLYYTYVARECTGGPAPTTSTAMASDSGTTTIAVLSTTTTIASTTSTMSDKPMQTISSTSTRQSTSTITPTSAGVQPHEGSLTFDLTPSPSSSKSPKQTTEVVSTADSCAAGTIMVTVQATPGTSTITSWFQATVSVSHMTPSLILPTPSSAAPPSSSSSTAPSPRSFKSTSEDPSSTADAVTTGIPTKSTPVLTSSPSSSSAIVPSSMPVTPSTPGTPGTPTPTVFNGGAGVVQVGHAMLAILTFAFLIFQ